MIRLSRAIECKNGFISIHEFKHEEREGKSFWITIANSTISASLWISANELKELMQAANELLID